MGAGRRAAKAMKNYLGIRDIEDAAASEAIGQADTLFGIDVRQKAFTRVRLERT
jgi:glutamate synthase (NADPH/NADH) small chain